jgi:protein ImuB
VGVPRLALARRFAGAEPQDDPLLRLDQAMGRRPEPLAPPEAPPGFLVRRVLAEAVQDPVPHLPALCADLCAALERAGFGARRVSLALFRTDGRVAFVEAATARATRNAAHLLRLLDGRVGGIDPGFGFDLLALAAPVAERLPARQPGLDRQGEQGDDLAHLIDRLHARFGEGALRRPVLRESHVPERREAWQAAEADPRPVAAASLPRPLRLFDPPEEAHGVLYAVPEGPPAQFTWRRVAHRVVRAAGPERIAPEWWRDRPGTRLRDYYRVEDEEGRRFWIFREGFSGDGRGDAPRWFVQGAFG